MMKQECNLNRQTDEDIEEPSFRTWKAVFTHAGFDYFHSKEGKPQCKN